MKKKGIFYDNSNQYIEDIVSYAIESNNKIYKNESFKFNYSITEVLPRSNSKLYRKCIFFLNF